MHSRHRGPGNGYRSNPRGMGGALSRIPPESSFRGGHGMFNPEYRNYNHGFGRGNPRPPGPPPTQVGPPTPQRRPDIFAEAGRLATEYLVSRGVLPPNVFTGNWQNGSLKNLMGDFRGFRQQEKDCLLHHRLRNGSDLPSGWKSQPDGSKSHSRDKRRSKSNELDSGREMGRSGSLSEKARPNLDLEEKGVDNEAGKVGKTMSQSRNVEPTSNVKVESQSLVDNFPNNDDTASNGKDLLAEADVESPKTVDDVKCLDEPTVDPKDGSDNSCLVEKQSSDKETVKDEPINHSIDNLSRHCSFSEVPTKSFAMRGSKGDLVPINEEENDLDTSLRSNCDGGPLAGSEVVFKDVSVDDSSLNGTPNQVEGSKCADHDSVKQTPEAGELDQMDTDRGKYTRSQSLPLGSLMYEHESNEGFLGIGRCSSLIMERGEKRTAEYIDDKAVMKKPREWDPTSSTQMDEQSLLSHSTLIQDQRVVDKLGPAIGGESLLQKNGVEVIEYTEEMQLFPASFRICDLNTVESSQRNEVFVSDPTLFPPSPERKMEVDLSISSNLDVSGNYTRRGTDGKEIEVIDLDDDCLQEDSVFESSERKENAAYMGHEGFPDHAQIVNDISSVQDDYGLMMSDFLGNDIAGPGNVNSLQNDMALDNGEGILGDDESIYMSLGEIPISFLGVWGQSTQDFDNKPF